MQKHRFLFVILLAVSLLQACSRKKEKVPETVISDTIAVKIIKLQQEKIRQAIVASGQFTTEDETLLSFKTGGIINTILVKEGDAVVKGQLLATLNLTEINAQVQQASIAYEKAVRDNKRAENLYKDSVGTLEQVQNSRTAVALSRQQLDAISFNKNYSEIRATTNGYVLRKFVQEGQVITSGTAVLQINGANNGNWVLKVALSDKEWSAISKGDKATITTDASTETLAAFVSAKSEGVDPITGTLAVSLKLLNSQTKKIAAGLFGKAIIIPSQTITSWSVPFDAVLDGDEGEGYVFITNDNKKAEKYKVKISSITNGRVLISGGLENAAAIIISGNAYLNHGSPITITQ